MASRYSLEIDRRVVKELKRVAGKDRQRLIAQIEDLPNNPYPKGTRKLVNQPGYRVRIGDYRILYEVDERENLIRVYRAGHRSEVYRQYAGETSIETLVYFEKSRWD